MLREIISKFRFARVRDFWKFFLFIMSLGMAVFPQVLPAQSVSFTWNPVYGTNVAGYVICYGSDGIHFNNQVGAGNNTFCTVTGLQTGATYYFTVMTYDVSNHFSPPSSLIEYYIPATTQTVTGPVQIQGQAQAQAQAALVPVQAQTHGSNPFTLLIGGNGTLSPARDGQMFQTGRKYTLAAIPSKGWVFVNWISNGIVVAGTPKYAFNVQPNLVLQANFAPNPFTGAAGTYHGLIWSDGDAAEEGSGYFVASVTSAGAYSAKIHMGSQSYSCSGTFSFERASIKTIARPGLSPITMAFQLGWNNGPMTGTVGDGIWTASFAAYPAIYSKTNPAPQAGKYTMAIPGSRIDTVQPGGNSFGTLTVDTLGNVSFKGILADDTPVACTSVVCDQGQWPFYASLYGGKGSILGWLSFATNGNIGGETVWFKLPQTTAKLYPGGFTQDSGAIGSIYHYTRGLPLLDFIAGNLSLTDGNLAQSIANQVVLGPDFEAAGQGAGGKSANNLTFDTSSGLFTASVMNPETGKAIPVNGVVLQNQNLGAGFFLGTTESGSVLLYPAR